ncbi:ATP phosphoribosyltransferase regulatory subunit [Candidatus Gracilibacteria bacterium]|nr:ATP phosphoribosyltransferase regulatory subunit [Candidatus Gracilibacteria bacterium]
MSDYAPVKGTKNTFPDDHKYLTFLKKVFRHELRKNGFRRISLPVFEDAGIVEKVRELNSNLQIDQTGVTLRRNSHIGVLKAYVDANIAEEIQPVYYYYMDRYFDYSEEKGYHEDYRIGGDILGEKDPILDAVMIYINYTILNEIGLGEDFKIVINSIGSKKEQDKYREQLSDFYEGKKHILSETAKAYLDDDPIKVFSSEYEDDKILASQAPTMQKCFKKESKAYNENMFEYLEILGVPYEIDTTLFPNDDYHCYTIWKIYSTSNSKVISEGSRYNTLSQYLNTPKEIPATGFYSHTGIIIDLLRERQIKIRNKDKIDLYFVQLGDEAKKVVLPLSLEARRAGINTVVSLGTPSMKEQMLKANRSGGKYVVIVGVMEARSGVFQVRDQVAGTQEEVHKDELIAYIIDKIGDEKLDFYCPVKDLVFDNE